MNIKIFNVNSFLHEPLSTTRQRTKLRNTFKNNMTTDIELPKAQISKIIQSGAFLEALLSKIAGPLCSSSIDEKHFSSIMINSWCYRN